METDDFSRSLLDGVAVLMRVSLQDMMAYIHPKGISMAQMNVLYQLYYRGPCDVLAFTRTHSLSPAGASQLIERMVRQGWVERVGDPADRRVHEVHLTGLGRQLAVDSIAARNKWITRFAARLTAKEQQQIARSFRLLAEKMEEEPA
ncbi:MAG: MarR family transcriptional regulator [Anaerolineales bacterium]